MYVNMIITLIYIFLLSAIGTIVLNVIFSFVGQKGFLGNLYPNVRGGIPRAIGIVPFLILCFYFLPGYNSLILIIGIFALFDDILGRKRIGSLPIEWGQLSRGIGMIMVFIAGLYLDLGIASIFIALLVQPMNIADMQPGSACMVTIVMSLVVICLMLILGTAPIHGLPAIYSPVILLLVCLAYSPLDFLGKIMLGEIGNHSFAIALAVCFYLVGGLIGLIILEFVLVCFIAFVRRSTLRTFFSTKLGISDPTFGDFFMDVLTGGGLGDLIRKLILNDKQYKISNQFLINLGFRRLLFNPFASRNAKLPSRRNNPKKPRLGKL